MLHVLLVWILDTLHQIDYSYSASSWGKYSLVHRMPTCSSDDAVYHFDTRCDRSHPVHTT